MFDKWSEVDQGEAMALVMDEESRCPCGCGNYKDEAWSREWDWDVNHFKCYAGAALDSQRRAFSKENQGYEAAHDGRLWTVSPVPPKTPRP